jgi:hypothetical protein
MNVYRMAPTFEIQILLTSCNTARINYSMGGYLGYSIKFVWIGENRGDFISTRDMQWEVHERGRLQVMGH